jgi:hypothetical protein
LAARTAHEAIDRYIVSLGRIVSCVTRTIMTDNRASRRRPGNLINVVLSKGEPVQLRGPGRLHLRVRMRLRIVEAGGRLWDAETAAYEYRLSDADDREILAYHWHPDGASHVRTPHLHLGPGAEAGYLPLATAHLPTGHVPLGDVLRLAVGDLGVAPIRQDWARVLVT